MGFICINLQLKSAALRDVGNATAQLPDITEFTSSRGYRGWQKLPSGLIIQWFYVSTQVIASSPFSTGWNYFPIAFPTSMLSIVMSDSGGVTSSGCASYGYEISTLTASAVKVWSYRASNPVSEAFSGRAIAIGY